MFQPRYPHLCSPLKVGPLTLRNRMASAPTSLATLGPGGHPSLENIAYYELRAKGGACIVTMGDVIVHGTGLAHPEAVLLTDPDVLPALVPLAEAIRRHGAVASIEIDHGGGKANPMFTSDHVSHGPSAIRAAGGYDVEPMSVDFLHEIADAYGKGAAVAKLAGFQMVTLHAGHGWLIHQFLSPLTNHREDEYGGSFENRCRFMLEVIGRIRAHCGPDFPIEVRMSGTELADEQGGYTLADGVEIAKVLDGKVDLIHVSTGGGHPSGGTVMHPSMFLPHGCNVYLAAEIKKHVSTPVCTVGAFSEPDKMEAFLAESGVDCIAMGRALIADPFLPKKLLRGQADQITPCLRCGECQSGLMKNRVLHCAVNPLIGNEDSFYHPIPTNHQRTVLIAGGGPAGCQAAMEAVSRGHKVVLCEKSDKLAGLKYADNADFKQNIARYRDSLAAKVAALPIDIRLNTTVTQEIVDEVRPDALIIAIGAQPWMLPVPRDDKAHIVFGADLRKDTPVGENVVVVGGGLIGSEEAVALAREGHKVTILEMQDDLAPDCGRMHRINLLHQIETEPNITVATGHRCTGIQAGCVTAAAPDGSQVSFPADTVVMAAGMRPDQDEVDRLMALVPESYVVGDAFRARQIGQATRDAVNAVVDLGL